MSHFRTFKQSCLAASALTLILAGFESSSYAVGDCLGGCAPQVPCPCAADGVCRPKRATWGYSQTRWRTWPGEQLGQQPTLADGATPDQVEGEALVPFETPPAEQEDLRGPAKAKVDRSDDEEATDEAIDGAVDDPAVLLPGPEALPAFDPQGNNQDDQFELPQMEDAPPALPASLRQAARSLDMLQQTTNQQPTTTQNIAASPVQQASWTGQPSIALINPASAIVPPQGETLQQAIYYEASDQSGQ